MECVDPLNKTAEKGKDNFGDETRPRGLGGKLQGLIMKM
jgi:hypothetical protein